MAVVFTSEIQPCLDKNQHQLNRAPPAQCFEPGMLTNTVSNLHSRGNLKKIEMPLSTPKFSQDSEDSIPTVEEQKLKSVFHDPKLQRPEVLISFSW